MTRRQVPPLRRSAPAPSPTSSRSLPPSLGPLAARERVTHRRHRSDSVDPSTGGSPAGESSRTGGRPLDLRRFVAERADVEASLHDSGRSTYAPGPSVGSGPWTGPLVVYGSIRGSCGEPRDQTSRSRPESSFLNRSRASSSSDQDAHPTTRPAGGSKERGGSGETRTDPTPLGPPVLSQPKLSNPVPTTEGRDPTPTSPSDREGTCVLAR